MKKSLGWQIFLGRAGLPYGVGKHNSQFKFIIFILLIVSDVFFFDKII